MATATIDLRDLFKNFVNAIRDILNDYNLNPDKDLRLAVNKVTDDNAAIVGAFPIIGVEFNGHREEAQTLGSSSRKHLVTFMGSIWYYHEKLGASERRMDIYDALSTIVGIIRENPGLGGFSLNTRIIGSMLRPRILSGTIISGGVVLIESDKVIRQDLV